MSSKATKETSCAIQPIGIQWKNVMEGLIQCVSILGNGCQSSIPMFLNLADIHLMFKLSFITKSGNKDHLMSQSLDPPPPFCLPVTSRQLIIALLQASVHDPDFFPHPSPFFPLPLPPSSHHPTLLLPDPYTARLHHLSSPPSKIRIKLF